MYDIVLNLRPACLQCCAPWRQSHTDPRRVSHSALFPLPSAFQGTGLVAALVIMVVVALVTVSGPCTPSPLVPATCVR